MTPSPPWGFEPRLFRWLWSNSAFCSNWRAPAKLSRRDLSHTQRIRMSSLYARWFFPLLLERSVGGEIAARERRLALQSVHGEVLEVGFGTGLNLPHYPSSVNKLIALDPEEMLPDKVSERISAVRFP